ncbi:TonB-dependent receptor [Rhodohalobacter halophilus]|uniref:TonB-dependent receptor n=1 Tax=Rhodohalobacter halophilus TaxID=1812810 RepID=UPI000A032FD3|nr:TonB-dependent receptor [Rhodohalobacter halophilus]
MSLLKFFIVLFLLPMFGVEAATTPLSDAINQQNNRIISGLILSADDLQPVAGAHVQIESEQLSAVSDEHGQFSLTVSENLTEATVRITHIGFRPLTRSLSQSELYSGDPLHFKLSPASEMMSPITVLSHRVMNSPSNRMGTDQAASLPIDSGQFLRDAGNASGIRKGGFGIDPVLRGLSGSRLNVRLDGLTATAAACPNRMDPPTSHIRLSDIERVEIHRGPHALKYGPSFGGTVNFVSHPTPDYIDFGMNGDVRAGFESNTNHRKTDARLQGGTDIWNFLLSGGLSSTGNYTGGNGQEVASGFESYDYGIEGGLRIAPSHRITAGWSQSFIRDADFPALMMDMAVDDTYKFKSGYEWKPAQNESVSSLELNGYWSLVDHEMNNHDRSSFEMRDAVALAETETYGVHGSFKGLYESGSYTIAGGFDQLDVTGTRYVDIKMGPQAGSSMTYNLWQDAEVFNAGLYAGIEHFIDQWTLSAGSRLDLNRADSNDPAPRFAGLDNRSEHLNLSLSLGVTRQISSSTSMGLYLGRGVRSPDVTERFINYLTIGRDSYEYAGNPDLDPEANNQADLVIKSNLGRFNVESTLFASYMTNYISAVINPDLTPVGMGAPGVREFDNRGDALFTGFELGFQYQFSESWSAGFNSSYTYAEYTDSGEAVAEIPPLETTLQLNGSMLSGKIFPVLNIRRVFPQTRYNEEFGENRSPGFWLTDITFASPLINGVTLSGGVRNLFDENYYEHLNRQFNTMENPSGGYLPEPGQRFFAEVSIRF